ncbi:2-oxoglutarate-Fe(II) type oxidoreductase hxnY-like isoform X4 [Dendrobium catenatum]|uniref:2-oxoglutarate-Fe(II) type oxidoreductase hxnY-like isoform X4 n=1 Tax=Dendrobium catenatum TaxID=906689 RepID=UPI00109FB79C|nr:2-oxoglutarate-Fe(II) type oxidoreductase hxnY-like isoform X4 [Dendrobium catenatum]
MNEVFFQSTKFFALPLHKKMELFRNEKLRGYTPTLDQTLDPENQVQGVEVPEDDPDAKKPFYGPNQWPSEDAGFFDKPEMLGEPLATLKLLHYEDKISDPARGIYGCGAHSDFGLINLLATDDVAGLQICKNKDARPRIWEDVAPLKGGFIINIGDLLERLSNDVFRSTLHRVVLDGQERYSVAFFADPKPECIVECLPSCTSDMNPPKYPPITCYAYMNQRYNDTHLGLNHIMDKK